MMAMFLIAGCQTTQLPEKTKPEEKVSKVELVEENTGELRNPFEAFEVLPPDILVTSQKPVVCGRLDTMLNNVFTQYGESPVIVGTADNKSAYTGEEVSSMITLTHNSETGTYSFLEQMPTEKRLVCMLSSGKAKIKLKVSGISS